VIAVEAFIERNPIEKDLIAPNPGAEIFVSIPIIVFAFYSHYTAVPVFDELSQRNYPTMHKVITTTTVVTFFTYVLAAVTGVWLYGKNVSGNILTDLPVDSILVAIGRVILVFSVCLGFPIQLWISRNSLERLFLEITKRPQERLDLRWYQNLPLTAFIIAAAAILSVLIPGISFLFSLLGSTTTMSTGFILPSVLYIRAVSKDRGAGGLVFKKIKAWFIFLFGIVMGILGAVTTVIYTDFGDHPPWY